ncbi:MAG: hypothetical protein JWO23_148 [Solirubrobacterales bacterium]|nr:hypothetical protein [Solirubrobacterales bacterium]
MHLSRPRAYRAIALLAAIAASTVVLAAPAFAGPTVTVRVEGEQSTLLPATTVTLGVPDPLNNCPANSVAAAINLATGGNWDHKSFTETILGETHSFAHSDTWAEWVDYKWGGGICNDLLNEGDEVVMVADLEPPPTFAASVLPLVVSEAPSVVPANSPVSVKVSIVHLPPGEVPPGSGTLEPAEGVTVSLGSVHVTTGPGGVANITPVGVGSQTLQATKAGDAPSKTLSICVHNGSDGNCGTQAPDAPLAAATPGSGAGGVFGSLNRYTGPYALVAASNGIGDGRVYARGHAPKLLSGSILAHNTVSSVSLELRRQYKRRCYAYDGLSERFKAARCGGGRFFKVSSGGLYSYLLPEALRPGRYVLDIQATDVAGNRTTLARGTSRLVFYVR